MLFDLIPIIIILGSLSLIIYIIIGKFSALANLNIDTIKAEKEARFKEQIISSRLKRNVLKYQVKIGKAVTPLASAADSFFKKSYLALVDLSKRYKHEHVKVVDNAEERIAVLFNEAEDSIKRDDQAGAERRFIEIISLDSKNVKAFKELGSLYFDMKNLNEARQTLEHALKLKEDQEFAEEFKGEQSGEETVNKAEISYELSLVNEAAGDLPRALADIERALAIDPNSPRFLDMKIDVCIAMKDKIKALEAYEKLAESNPENKKLADIKEKINEL